MKKKIDLTMSCIVTLVIFDITTMYLYFLQEPAGFISYKSAFNFCLSVSLFVSIFLLIYRIYFWSKATSFTNKYMRKKVHGAFLCMLATISMAIGLSLYHIFTYTLGVKDKPVTYVLYICFGVWFFIGMYLGIVLLFEKESIEVTKKGKIAAY